MFKGPLLLVVVLERHTVELRPVPVAVDLCEAARVQSVLQPVLPRAALVPPLSLVARVVVVHNEIAALCS